MKAWIKIIILSVMLSTLIGCEETPLQPLVSGTTSIEFSIEQPGRVTLKIVDRYNALIYETTTDSLDVGSHSITWYLVDMHNDKIVEGVYFYTLFLNDSQITGPKPMFYFSGGGD